LWQKKKKKKNLIFLKIFLNKKIKKKFFN